MGPRPEQQSPTSPRPPKTTANLAITSDQQRRTPMPRPTETLVPRHETTDPDLPTPSITNTGLNGVQVQRTPGPSHTGQKKATGSDQQRCADNATTVTNPEDTTEAAALAPSAHTLEEANRPARNAVRRAGNAPPARPGAPPVTVTQPPTCQDYDHGPKPIHIIPHPHTAPSGPRPRPPSSFFNSVAIQTSTGDCASDDNKRHPPPPSDLPMNPLLPMFAIFAMPYT